MGRRLDNLTGQRFGCWEVLERHGSQGHQATWLCKCSCGGVQVVRGSNLRSGKSKRCLSCANESMKLKKHTGELPTRFWGHIVTNAAQRGIPVLVSRDYIYQLFLSQQRRCALTGVPICFSANAKRYKDTTASLDRIDSTLPYQPGNIWWVHKRVNMMKQSLSVDEFQKWCRLVVEKGKSNVEGTGISNTSVA